MKQLDSVSKKPLFFFDAVIGQQKEMITEFGALSTDRIRNTLSAFGSHALPNTLSALHT